jgi:hypothetical protein
MLHNIIYVCESRTAEYTPFHYLVGSCNPTDILSNTGFTNIRFEFPVKTNEPDTNQSKQTFINS